MKKKNIFFIMVSFLFVTLFLAYRIAGVGGRIIKVGAASDKGFNTEYYLFIPDTLKVSDSTFLLVEPNNTGFVDDRHKKHKKAAYDTIRFGQSHQIARKLGIPLLIPCFDRPKEDWQIYTHALDRDTLLCEKYPLIRIDKQLNFMIDDAKMYLDAHNIHMKDKVLLNGFSASGSFVNRFTALYPQRVAAVAAGGINGMAILPVKSIKGNELVYPVGISDIKQIAGLDFNPSAFASVPQYYYMGADDENDTLPFDDAFSPLERELIIKVLGEDMSVRWEKCQNLYESQNIRARFNTYHGVGHGTTPEINADIVSFFKQVIDEYKK
ncbi:MAG: hypothetical protein E7247_17445 [Paenibacillaceae bacterium]|nr:hypothetical protein [Paenibacillaceae bacterium]